MFRKCSSLLAAILTCAIPLKGYATINETVKLTFDQDYRWVRVVSVEEERILLGLINFDSNSFTEQWTLYSINNSYEITELFTYPEVFDAEVSVEFLHTDNTLYSVAFEGIYQVDMESFTAQKIARPEVVYPTATMEEFDYETYYQSFPRKTGKYFYTYEMAVWDENDQATLAKISRLEDGEFVDYFVPGFTRGARTSRPSVHAFGLSFRDEENLYILPDNGELLSFAMPQHTDTRFEVARHNSFTYFSGDAELIKIRPTGEGTFIQEVLLDLKGSGESLLTTLSTREDHYWAFATVDENNVYRIYLVTEQGLLPSIEVEISDSEQNIFHQIKGVYLHPHETVGVIRINDSFLVYDATTGQIQDSNNRFEDTGGTELIHYFGDAILVLEKPSRFAETLSKATFINNDLNSIDVTDQIDNSVTPECQYFSYFGENGSLNIDLVDNFLSSRCPSVGHYVVTDSLDLVQTPLKTDREAWQYSNSYIVFNNQRHSFAGSSQGEISLLSWHGSNDFDLDGVADSDDVFPDDLTESADNDSDGTGDNADTDDDNDGILDINDPQPLIANITDDTADNSSSNSSSGGTFNLHLLFVLLLSGTLRRLKTSK